MPDRIWLQSKFWLALIMGSAILMALLGAWEIQWTCDDAFISFRYALQWLEGNGLVYNVGEKVEGYSNFLWTIWSAVGIKFGVSVELWSTVWGIFFYAVALILLAQLSFRFRSLLPDDRFTWPVMMTLVPFVYFWMVFATGGLETSMFTSLLVIAFVLLWRNPDALSNIAWAGMIAGLASITRPDGVLFPGLAGLFLLARFGLKRWQVYVFSVGFLLIYLPHFGWRWFYYGDIFPNTYYAKSAHLSWYSQGWIYFKLFFAKYWSLLLSLPLWGALGVHLFRNRQEGLSDNDKTLLWQGGFALAFAAFYSFYVVRVGGDFMYGRFFVPTLPFWLIALEVAWVRLLPQTHFQIAGGVAFVLMLAIPSHPHRKVINKLQVHYDNDVYLLTKNSIGMEKRAKVVRKYIKGLPVKMAFWGMEARFVYYAEPHTAIEAATGLTDHFIARLPIKERRAVGHEKNAPPSYILKKRKVHFMFSYKVSKTYEHKPLLSYIPRIVINFGTVGAYMLHWDTKLLIQLKKRGALFKDYPKELDNFLKIAHTLSQKKVGQFYNKAKMFYFDHNSDPIRHKKFLTLLSRKAPAVRRPQAGSIRTLPTTNP